MATCRVLSRIRGIAEERVGGADRELRLGVERAARLEIRAEGVAVVGDALRARRDFRFAVLAEGLRIRRGGVRHDAGTRLVSHGDVAQLEIVGVEIR